MKPNSDEHRERLSKALEHSYQELQPFRRSRRQLIEDFAGSRYGEDLVGTAKPAIYVNLIQIAAEAYEMALSYNDPRFLITSTRGEYEGFAKRFQVALNTYAQKVFLGDTLRAIIADAIFLVGIGKSYLEDSAEVYHENDVWMDPGMPYLGRVTFDNWVHDVSKSDFRKAQFYGDRYQMDLEIARNCPFFNKRVREDLLASKPSDRPQRDELTSSVASSTDHDDSEIEDVVDLVDIYLPKDRLVVTWPVREAFTLDATAPLSILPWDGAETGPYRFLSFIQVPDNIMPTSPAQSLCELFYLFNFLMRRIARQAKQAKTVIPYEPGSQDDMTRAMQAQDYQTVKVSRIQGINTLKFPGPDQSTINFTMMLQELFMGRASGNIEQILGLGPSADTLGQEQMVANRVMGRMANSRRKVNRFVSEAGTDIGWMLFDDPLQVIPGEREIPGTDYTIDASWLPPDMLSRQGSFADYQITNEPYSMEYKSPEHRLAGIYQDMQILGPLIPLFQQMGHEFQPQALLEDIAELRGEPRLKRYFRPAPPPMSAPGEQPNAMQGGPREYIRRNVSAGPTSAGRMQQLMQQPEEQQVMSGMGAA